MITANPNSLLGEWCRRIDAMEPGQCLDVDIRELRDIASYDHNSATFTPPDRILGNIVGSSYTHSYRMHPNGRTVTFIRHENTGQRRHEDPDRREKR